MTATKNGSAKSEENDYDPHEHRSVKMPTTNSDTFIHFLKASIGTGVLAMPNAFSNAGYINGFIFTIVIGGIAVYCLHLVINSMYELCKRKRIPYLTYPEAMTAAFLEGPPCMRFLAKIATPFVDGFLAFYHFGICSVYVVFVAESVKQIVDEYLIVLSVRIHMCFVIIPLFVIFSIRQLKHLVPFSTLANVLMFFGFGVVLYYIFDDLPPLSVREPFESVSRLPLFFGTVLFSLEAVGVVIAIEQNMLTPKSYVGFFGILNRGMFVVLGLYIGLGFFGYWRYGDDAKGSVTLNIPQDEILAQVVKIVFAFTTLISYALQGYVTADIIWNHYLIKKTTEKSNRTLYELLVRACIIIMTFLAAVAVPDISLFLSLVGAFCLSLLGIIFPALLDVCVRYNTSYGKLNGHLIKDCLLVAFGVIGGCIGTFVSVSEIVNANSDTFIHFLKASIGTGVLAMPNAFSNAGYINGFIFTIVIGGIAVYCLHLVINSMYELCKRKRIPYLTYPEAMTAAFLEGPPCMRFLAKIATPFVDGFLAFYHFGICSVYVVFVAESVKQIVDEYLIVLSVRIHMCFVIIPLFVIFSIRQLKHLVPFSTLANVLMFFGFGVVLYYIFDDLPPLSVREPFESVSRLPLFFGTVLFSLEAVGVVIAIEQNMLTPKSYVGFFGILNRGMFVVLGLYIGLGFFGYWRYGDDAKGSVTLNIPQDEILAQVVKIVFAFTTLISYALQGYVTADIIWNHYLIKKTTEKSNRTLYELLVRACIIIMTFLAAVAVPDISLFLSLVGAFCLSLLGIIFPALLDVCVQYNTSYGKLNGHLIKDCLLVAFGVIGGCIGTFVSVSEIVNAYT